MEIYKGISPAEFTSRKENTLELMKAAGLNALVAFSSYQEREGNVCYLCNYHNSSLTCMSHIGMGYAAYVLFSNGFSSLIVPSGITQPDIYAVDQQRAEKNLVDGILGAFQEQGLKEGQVGIAGMDVLPVEYYQDLEKAKPGIMLVSANHILENQRIIKSEAEVDLLSQAARIGGTGLKAGLQAIKFGATRQDVEMAARSAAMRAGADFISRLRVSSGKKLAPPTWPPTSNQVLEEGDFVYLELSGWFARYSWDSSQAAVVGKPSPGQQAYLDHLREATDWMISMLKPGRQMEFVMTESRHRFIIPTAHGIGLEICEYPWIKISQYFTLQPGMVLCVEPPVISPEFGQMSVKDTVVVTQSGIESITNFVF